MANLSNIDRISDSSILSDLLNYSKRKKAEIVFYKCLRLGKIELADKIRVKYGLNIHFDLVMAHRMCLFLTHKKYNKNKKKGGGK